MFIKRIRNQPASPSSPLIDKYFSYCIGKGIRDRLAATRQFNRFEHRGKKQVSRSGLKSIH
jgi:hypothetical protein